MKLVIMQNNGIITNDVYDTALGHQFSYALCWNLRRTLRSVGTMFISNIRWQLTDAIADFKYGER